MRVEARLLLPGGMSTTAGPQPLRGLTPQQVEADQRARVHTALGAAMARHSYEQMTVEHLIKGAGISRRTFYELFADKSEAFCAAHGEALADLERCVQGAARQEPDWPAATAAGIAAALAHFAADPPAAHLITAEPLAAGPRPAYCHRLLVERFSPCLRQGREVAAASAPGAVAARGDASLEPGPHLEELLLAGFAATVAAKLREGRAEALPGLGPSLTRLVLTPYLGGEEALHRELNHLRKGIFYEGDDLDAEEIEIEDTLASIEQAVANAERARAAEGGEGAAQ